LTILFTHYGRDIKLDELCDALAADYFKWLREDQGLAEVSINCGCRP